METRQTTEFSPLDRIHVLVVEDDPDCREMFRAILESVGARVTTAGSGREALRELEAVRPDVILSDLAMPDGDGCWLIRQLRTIGPHDLRSLPAVAVTAHGSARYRERALADGFNRYLEKPVDLGPLCRVLEELVPAITA